MASGDASCRIRDGIGCMLELREGTLAEMLESFGADGEERGANEPPRHRQVVKVLYGSRQGNG